MRRLIPLLLLLGCSGFSFAQAGTQPIQDFIRVPAGVIALDHLRVVDGTGAAVRADQTIVISADKITSIGATGAVEVPPGAKHLDFTGYTALPGLVGMHDHLFYPAGGGIDRKSVV